MILSPSILSADFSALLDDIKKIERGGADYIHVDVMDGHFVPNISFGAPVMKCLNGKTSLPYDVHLMIENPDKYIPDFVTPQTGYITVHQEACDDLKATLDHIHSLGVKTGVSLRPLTPVSTISEFIDDIDLVLIMSVNPGFGGQSFMPETLSKAGELLELRRAKAGRNFVIEIDGGINIDNLKVVLDAGVEMIVAGSAIFKNDAEKNTRDFIEKAKEK